MSSCDMSLVQPGADSFAVWGRLRRRGAPACGEGKPRALRCRGGQHPLPGYLGQRVPGRVLRCGTVGGRGSGAEGEGAVDVYGEAYHAGQWYAVGWCHVRWASRETARRNLRRLSGIIYERWSMTQLDSCRQVLADISAMVAATLPPGRARTLLALVRAGETMAL